MSGQGEGGGRWMIDDGWIDGVEREERPVSGEVCIVDPAFRKFEG